jgi:LysM repeat protein
MRHDSPTPTISRPVQRRGWWLRWSRLLGLAVSVAAVALIAGLVSSTSHASSPEPTQVVVVQPGDTLWSIAARHLPSRDPYGMIGEIQRRNGLADLTIYPGQELVLP